MADLCALFRRKHLPRGCKDCGDPQCTCLRTQDLEDRQARLDYALGCETELAYAEARARLSRTR